MKKDKPKLELIVSPPVEHDGPIIDLALTCDFNIEIEFYVRNYESRKEEIMGVMQEAIDDSRVKQEILKAINEILKKEIELRL